MKKSRNSGDAMLEHCCFRPHKKLGSFPITLSPFANTLTCRLRTTVFSEVFAINAELSTRSLKIGDWRQLF